MTKKDYVLIAKVFARNNGITNVQELAIQMAYALQETNPLFDKGRFLEACGVNQ